jgi:hypothetical protein
MANYFSQFGFAWSIPYRLFRPRGRRWIWRSVGATRKRRTCACAICDSTEPISSANRTSQFTASFSSGLRGSPVFPCRTPSSRINSRQYRKQLASSSMLEPLMRIHRSNGGSCDEVHQSSPRWELAKQSCNLQKISTSSSKETRRIGFFYILIARLLDGRTVNRHALAECLSSGTKKPRLIARLFRLMSWRRFAVRHRG